MKLQVLPDGADFENSIAYHRLVLDTFLGSHILAERNGGSFSNDSRSSLERMLEFVVEYTQPNGRVLSSGQRRRLPSDLEYAIFIGSRNTIAICPGLGRYSLSSKRLHNTCRGRSRCGGGGCLAIGRALGSTQIGRTISRCIASISRIGSLCDARPDNYAFICAYLGRHRRAGKPQHNDISSFHLSIDGAEVVVDPWVLPLHA